MTGVWWAHHIWCLPCRHKYFQQLSDGQDGSFWWIDSVPFSDSFRWFAHFVLLVVICSGKCLQNMTLQSDLQSFKMIFDTSNLVYEILKQILKFLIHFSSQISNLNNLKPVKWVNYSTQDQDREKRSVNDITKPASKVFFFFFFSLHPERTGSEERIAYIDSKMMATSWHAHL